MRTRARVISLLFLLFAWNGVRPERAGADVAVIMSANVDAYREALDGFKATAHQKIATVHDMEGDLSRGQKILSEIQTKVKPDLILALGHLALQLCASQPTNVPVVYAMVLNPTNIVGGATKYITGASMNVPVDKSIRLFKELGTTVRRVGVVYSQAQTGYLVRAAAAVASAEGLVLKAKDIKTPKEAIAAVDALLQDGIDALWILPDDTVLVSAQVVDYMLLVSFRNRIPLLGLSDRQFQKGTLLSLSFKSSEDIGRQAGELAASILAGKAPDQIPYTQARETKLSVNLITAQKLNVVIPQALLSRADAVIK
jgi:putative ABC transport system substrate-binding protein